MPRTIGSGAWVMFLHGMRHGLLIDGGNHHLDQLRNLCGTDCKTIAGWDWNPGHVRGETTAWRGSDSFDGEASALLVMRMTNGSFTSYEGNNLETGMTNSWYGEYYLLECEGGAAVLDRDHIVRIEERSAAGTLQTREVPPVEAIREGHQAVAAQFLDWLYGAPPPETTLADNLQSTAMLFAAIRASETGMRRSTSRTGRERWSPGDPTNRLEPCHRLVKAKPSPMCGPRHDST